MTDSGSGQRDDRDPQPDDLGGSGSGGDYSSSASWETGRGSSWENTTPYESPWAAPRSSGTAASGASATERRTEDGRPDEDGPWPTYPQQHSLDDRQSRSPGSYPTADDPYQTGYSQPPYPQQPYPPQPYPPQPAYGQPSYPQQPDYGQPDYEQQPGYAVNPYQQPVFGGYVPPNHPQATTALILGIVGLALCPFVGIGGFVLGGRARREIDAAPGQWGGRGTATAGWVLGIVSIVYAALVVLYVVIIGIGVAVSGT